MCVYRAKTPGQQALDEQAHAEKQRADRKLAQSAANKEKRRAQDAAQAAAEKELVRKNKQKRSKASPVADGHRGVTDSHTNGRRREILW